MKELESLLARIIDEICEEYSAKNIPEIDLEINISGRVDTGNVSVEYKMGAYHDKARATGSDLHAVICEYAHRKGWEKIQAIKFLPRSTQRIKIAKTLDDEIPF